MKKIIIIFIAMFLFADPPWSINIKVSQDPGTGNQNETTIGIFGGNLVCGGWNDSRQTTYHVGFVRSTNGGSSFFLDTLMIEPTYPGDCDPCIAISDSGHIYYFWLSYNPSNYTGDIYFAKSTNWGQSWGPMNCATPGTPNTLDDKPWAIIDNNNIFLSWYDYGGTGALRFKRSTNLGQDWMSPVTIGSGGNGTMCIRGTDSMLYVGWGYQDLRFNRSTNMGTTWLGQATIITCPWSPPSTPYRLNNIPCFKSNNARNVLYVVFADSRFGSGQVDVSFSKSTNQGVTWSTPVKINDTPSGDTTLQFYPFMAIDPNDNIHVVWYDTRGGSRYYVALYYSYSTDQGATWTPNQRVTENRYYTNTFIGDYLACAVDANYVYALWCDCRNGSTNPDAYFSRTVNPVGIKENKTTAHLYRQLTLEVPNPFTKNSKIKYSPQNAVLNIYQIDGRKIRFPDAPGVYFVVLQNGDEMLCKKLIMIE